LSGVCLAVFLLLSACGKPPLVPEKPTGPSTWLKGVPIACSTKTTDPSGAKVSYQFDWGDNTQSEWSEFVEGGVVFADTHTYAAEGSYRVKARARNSKRRTGWSDELNVNVSVGEGQVLWWVTHIDPDEGEDSADFSNNTFAIGPDGATYTGCVDYGALLGRKATGGVWKFRTAEEDEFFAAPAVGDSLVFIGCTNDSVYAVRLNGTRKWSYYVGGAVYASAALGADGTVHFHTEDSMLVALNQDGTLRWTYPTSGGYSSPVVGSDGTVYVASGESEVFALDPAMGTMKWSQPYRLSSNAINASPALDATRGLLYVVDDAGSLAALNLDGTLNWQYSVGEDASSPVIGADGTVYICGGGRLRALNPGTQDQKWAFVPPLFGIASTPAVSADGYVYFLVMPGRKAVAQQSADTLYAVNPDGTRRWACGLGEGMSDVVISAPKIGNDGLIYVGDGTRGWCVVGLKGPAQSAWPQFQRDGQNSGRAR
jgi:outer membrane protein assembly factor BamB